MLPVLMLKDLATRRRLKDLGARLRLDDLATRLRLDDLATRLRFDDLATRLRLDELATRLRLQEPGRRRAALYGGGALAGLLLIWLVAFVAAGDGVPHGTTVRGVPIGGMSRAEAQATLQRELGGEARAGVPVRVGREDYRIDPGDAGLTMDVAATVDAAGGRTWNPVVIVQGWFGGTEVDPVATTDHGELKAAVDDFAEKVDGEPVDGDVRFRGAKVVTVPPREGVELDRAGAAEALRSGYLRHDDPIVLPAAITAPGVDADEVRRAAREFARPAVSAPVTLLVDGQSRSVEPQLIGPALALTPDHGRLRPSVDGKKLRQSLAEVLDPFETDARDATFRIVDGRPQVVPSEQGLAVAAAELADAIRPALTEKGADRIAKVSLQPSEPTLTTQEATGLGVQENVSEFTTYYPSDFAPRLTNIHRAADLMDNTLLLPGETFSLNDAVGERTAARGFAAGYIINNGKLEVDYGGGVSQLATTTFNAAFFAGLEDVEHHPHSFYISRYPEGREATVAWGFKDLRFRNDTDHGAFITTSYTDGSVTVQIWGTKEYRIEAIKSDRTRVKPFKTIHDERPRGTEQGDCVPQDGVDGFTVYVTREFYVGGDQVRSERLRTRYNPEDRIVCGSSDPQPSPVPSD